MTAEFTESDLTWARGYTDPAAVRRFVLSRRETMPTRRVWRGSGAPSTFTDSPADLLGMSVALPGRQETTLEALLAEAETDGIVVLHRGRTILERYPHGMRPHELHLTASMAKSFLGLLFALTEHDGLVDRSRPAAHYVPELRGTAFGDETLQSLLHMGAHVSYSGRTFDHRLEAQRFFAVVGPRARPFGYRGPTTILEHLRTATHPGPQPEHFCYENGNVEAVAEVLRRVTTLTTAELLSELVWSRIGAEEDAFYVLDEAGAEMASGGFSAALRDVARVGEMIRCGGAVDGRQVVPPSVVHAITSGTRTGAAEHVRFPRSPADTPATMSYHDFWWLLNDPHGSLLASGIHGQHLFVSPGRECVIAHFGSHILSPAVPPPPMPAAYLRIGSELGRRRERG